MAGELRIAASTVPAEHFLMALLAEFRTIHPRVHVAADVGERDSGLGSRTRQIRSVQSELDSGRLREIRIEGLDLTRELYIVSDRRRALPPPARAFMHFLLTHKPDDLVS